MCVCVCVYVYIYVYIYIYINARLEPGKSAGAPRVNPHANAFDINNNYNNNIRNARLKPGRAAGAHTPVLLLLIYNNNI